MATVFVRVGSAWREVETRVRRSSAWGLAKASIPSFLSSLIYTGPTWTLYLATAQAQNKFSDGADKNLLTATGATSDVHTVQRAAYTVTTGLTYRISIRGQGTGVSTFLGFEFYNGASFAASAGKFNPTTGVANGTGVGTLTDLGGGIYRYDKDYVIPAGMTALTVRMLLGNSTTTGAFIPAGEGIYVSNMTITQL